MYNLSKQAPKTAQEVIKASTPIKLLSIMADSSLGNRCYYYILSFYWQKIPSHYDGDCFYLRPCPDVPKDTDKPWFLCQPIGRNTLDGMVSKMGKTVGMTNHSLRITGTTRLFNAHVPEKIVQERSGHLSLESLHCYERTSPKLFLAFSPLPLL